MAKTEINMKDKKEEQKNSVEFSGDGEKTGKPACREKDGAGKPACTHGAGKWRETTLGEVANVNPRESLKKGTHSKYVGMEKLAPFTRKIRSFEEKDFNGGTKFRNGDTLLARITPCLENGKTAYVDILEKAEIGYGSTEYIVIREKDNLSDKKFLYYFAISPQFRNAAIQSMTGTSGRQRVQTDLISDKVFSFPSLPEQKAIAAVLSSFDDKVELLREQNKTLEDTAQAIFKEWFVNNSGVKKEKLGDILEVKRGGSPRPIHDYISDTGLRWLKISDASATQSPFIFEIKECIKEVGLSKTTHLESGSLVLSNSATPGIPKILAVDSCIHDGWLHFPKSKLSNECLYLLFQEIRPQLIQQGSGSVFKNLKTDILKNYLVLLPRCEILEKLDKTVKLIFKKIYVNSRQIQALSKIRDTLLPKLMKGQIRVSDQ